MQVRGGHWLSCVTCGATCVPSAQMGNEKVGVSTRTLTTEECAGHNSSEVHLMPSMDMGRSTIGHHWAVETREYKE